MTEKQNGRKYVVLALTNTNAYKYVSEVQASTRDDAIKHAIALTIEQGSEPSASTYFAIPSRSFVPRTFDIETVNRIVIS